MNVTLGAANAAGTAAFNAMRGIPVASKDVHQHGVEALMLPIHQAHNHGKVSALPRTAVVLVSLAAALGVVFLALRCFRSLRSRKNTYLKTRRLAVGGYESSDDESDPCPVSRDGAGQAKSFGSPHTSYASPERSNAGCLYVTLALLTGRRPKERNDVTGVNYALPFHY